MPKKLVWNQRKLKEIAERITAAADDPGEYIDISYKVAERKCCIFAIHVTGKTLLLKTLDPKTTLFFNIEAGEIAGEDWAGASISFILRNI